MWPHGRDMACPGCPLNWIPHWCMWVTLSQAMSLLCPGWISSSSQAAQETQIYLNPGFSCAASQQGPVSSLSGTEMGVCSSFLGHRWGKHGLVGSAVAGGDGECQGGGEIAWLCSFPLFTTALHWGVCSAALRVTVATPRDGLCLLNALLLE